MTEITCAICKTTDKVSKFKKCIKCKLYYCREKCLSTVTTIDSRNCGCPDNKKLNRKYFNIMGLTLFNYNCRCGFSSYDKITCCTKCVPNFDKLIDPKKFYKYL